MEGIQLHDKDEECIGTVLLLGEHGMGEITDAWDVYLEGLLEHEEADIYEFVSKGNFEICEVFNLEFYQP